MTVKTPPPAAHTPLRVGNGGESHGTEFEIRLADDADTYVTGIQWANPGDAEEGYMLSYSQARELAAFIVRACNSHYSLIEALRGIIDHFDCNHGNAPGHGHLIPGVWDKDVSNGAMGGTKCGWCEQWSEARAALSQAGGASE